MRSKSLGTEICAHSPIGLLNIARDVKYAEIDTTIPDSGPTKLVLKTLDAENTVFSMPYDPLSIGLRLPTSVPVWKLNLANIQLHTYLPSGGPLTQFLSSNTGDVLMFNLSARLGERPTVHINADFDEVICYVRGPGVRGGCSEPGTLTCVPKGVIHHGPSENVPGGYQAWLMETRTTLRWTSEAIAASALMERRLPTAPEREQTMRVATLRVAQVEVFAERARVLHVENVQRGRRNKDDPSHNHAIV